MKWRFQKIFLMFGLCAWQLCRRFRMRPDEIEELMRAIMNQPKLVRKFAEEEDPGRRPYRGMSYFLIFS